MFLQADGNAEFALAMGVELDLTSKSLGIRSRRYSMIVDELEVWSPLEPSWADHRHTHGITCPDQKDTPKL